MTFQEIMSVIGLLVLMAGGYVKLKTDIAQIFTRQEDQKEAFEKWRLESADIMAVLQNKKADKELMNTRFNELVGQVTQIRTDNTREHEELKKTLQNIENYLRK